MAGARAIRVDDQDVSVTLGWLQMDAPEPTFITHGEPRAAPDHDYCSFFGPMWCGTSVLGPPP